MPMGVDWSRAIRECDDVDEYLLLGEADDGSCGHLWYTTTTLTARSTRYPRPPFPQAHV